MMRFSTFLALFVAYSPVAVLSSPRRVSTNAESSTDISGSTSLSDLGSTATDTAVGPADTGLTGYSGNSEKHVVPGGQGPSSALTGLDAATTGLSIVQHAYSPAATDTGDLPSESDDACLFDEEEERYFKPGGPLSVLSAPSSILTGGDAGASSAIDTVLTMPTDAMTTSSSSSSSSLAAYAKRQVTDIASATSLSTSTITGAPLSVYEQKATIIPGAGATTSSQSSGVEMEVVLPGSQTISADISMFTGRGGSKKMVIKKLGCEKNSGSRKQLSPNSGSLSLLGGTTTGASDQGLPTLVLPSPQMADYAPAGALTSISSSSSLAGYEGSAVAPTGASDTATGSTATATAATTL